MSDPTRSLDAHSTRPGEGADEPRTADHTPASSPETRDRFDSPPGSDAHAAAPPGFVLERELGRGGMGVVYLARQAGLNRPVALKMILGGARADRKAVIRFLAEAESVAAVRHPNVVEVYQYGEHAGRPFMALEFCPGGSLADALGGTPSDPRTAAGTVAAVAEGVAAAHALGIVHRDLKPGNVLIAADGSPKVTDFGLAKNLAGDSGLTVTHAVMGTPAYMSPEQAAGNTKFVGPQADVWALGVMLYECLCGERPFRGNDAFALLGAVARGEFKAPRRVNPGVPRDPELICLKCLRPEGHERYASAKELAADLRNWLAGRPILARPAGRVETAVKWVRRNKAVGAALAAAVLAMAAGTGVSVWQAVRANRAAADAGREAARASGEAAAAVAAEQRAKDSEQKARDALAEAEATLAESLLRPVGADVARVSALELAALEKLADTPSDALRFRFLRLALADAETARRVAVRAAPVARALVGLDRSRKAAVERTLGQRLREEPPRDVQLACLNLAAALRCDDPDLADRATAALLALARKPTTVRHETAFPAGIRSVSIEYVNQTTFQRVVADAGGLTGGLSPEAVGRHAQTAAEALAAADDPVNAKYLGTVLAALIVRMPAGEGERHSGLAAGAVLASLPRHANSHGTLTSAGQFESNADFSLHLRTLALFSRGVAPGRAEEHLRTFLALARDLAVGGGRSQPALYSLLRSGPAVADLFGRLPPDRARLLAGELAGVVLPAFTADGPRADAPALAAALALLAPHVPPDAAGSLAELLVGKLEGLDGFRATTTARSLATALPFLDERHAAPLAEKMAERLATLLADGTGKTGVEATLAESLAPLLARVNEAKARELAGRAVTGLYRAAKDDAPPRPLPGATAVLIPYLSAEVIQTVAATELGAGDRVTGFPTARKAEPALILALAAHLPPDQLSWRLPVLFAPGLRTEVTAVLVKRIAALPAEAVPPLVTALLARGVPSDPETGTGVAAVLEAAVDRLTPDQVRVQAEALVARVRGPQGSSGLGRPLNLLLAKLPEPAAGQLAGQALESLVGRLAKPARVTTPGGFRPRPFTPPSPDRWRRDFAALAPRLSAPEASALATPLVNALPGSGNALELAERCRCLMLLLQRLPDAEADPIRRRCEDVLLAELGRVEVGPPGPGRPGSHTNLERLAEALAELPESHARLNDAHEKTLLAVLNSTRSPDDRLRLARVVSGLGPYLDGGGRARVALPLARAAVDAAAASPSLLDRLALTRALVEVHPLTPVPERDDLVGRLSATLVRAWEESPEELLTSQGAEIMTALAAVLPPASATSLADRVLAALRRPGDPTALLPLMQALARRVPPEQARRYRTGGIRAALTAATLAGKAEGKSAAWESLLPDCSPDELAEVLRSPACVGEAEKRVLAEVWFRVVRRVSSP